MPNCFCFVSKKQQEEETMAGEVDQERHSSVQEMVNHGVHELPNKYICKDPVYDGSKNPTSLPSIEIPVI